MKLFIFRRPGSPVSVDALKRAWALGAIRVENVVNLSAWRAKRPPKQPA